MSYDQRMDMPNTETSVAALKYAVSLFNSQADFIRALSAATNRKITSGHLANWLKRGKGVSADVAPEVEEISGVAVERLCPGVSWGKIRARRMAPPLPLPPQPKGP